MNGRGEPTAAADPPSVYTHGLAMVPRTYEKEEDCNYDRSKTFAPNDGTSLSAPAVAGLVCLIAQVTPKEDWEKVLHKDVITKKLFTRMDVIRSPKIPHPTVGINTVQNFFFDCIDNPSRLRRIASSN